ncbi:MAG: serine hydrolase [Candidatus Thorarchaeota archaeon]|nr:serine hydrolase [Candidatus Thorarchaeota archaeon]
MSDVAKAMEKDAAWYIVASLDKYKIPGCSIAVVDKAGPIWSRGFGHIDREETKEVDPETLFMIGSLSKAYTVTAYLRAMQKGLLSLDDLLVDYYPEFSWRTRYGDEERKRITFRHLLTHWAGFQHNAKLYDAKGKAISFSDYISGIANMWQKYPVGSRFSYSNIGFDLAAYTIERITGSKFENFMKKEVYQPLGMTRSTVLGTEALAGENMARGYVGDVRTSDEMIHIPQLGAGAQFSCVHDMAKFLQMHFNEGMVGGKRFLSKEILNEMYTIPYQDPHQLMATGMGIGVIKFRHGGQLQLSFFGDGPGYIGLHQFYPHLGVGWLIQVNQAENVFPFVRELIEKIRRPVLERVMKEVPEDLSVIEAIALPKETTLDAASLWRLEGKYISRMLDIDVKNNDGYLSFNIGGQEVTLTPHSETQFSSQEFPLVEFRRDSLGRPTTIKLVRPYGEVTILDYDSGPADAAGPNESEWEKYLGVYGYDFFVFRMYSTPMIRNGHLHLLSTMNNKEFRLTKWRNDIFFTADGQNVIFNAEGFEMPGSTWVRDDISVELIRDLPKKNPDDIRLNEISLTEYADLLRRTDKEKDAKVVEELKSRRIGKD